MKCIKQLMDDHQLSYARIPLEGGYIWIIGKMESAAIGGSWSSIRLTSYTSGATLGEAANNWRRKYT